MLIDNLANKQEQLTSSTTDLEKSGAETGKCSLRRAREEKRWTSFNSSIARSFCVTVGEKE